MLQRLGRWLRTAGYDTEIINDGRHDYELIQQARKENRLLLSCDQALSEYRGADKVVVILESGSLDELVNQITDKCQVNWKMYPFSRCISCNTLLNEATARQRENLPVDIKKRFHEIFYCSKCNKVYWDGGHVQRMCEQLEDWSRIYN